MAIWKKRKSDKSIESELKENESIKDTDLENENVIQHSGSDELGPGEESGFQQESLEERVSKQIDILENTIVDSDSFVKDEVSKENAESTTHELAKLLQEETTFLKENQLVLQRLKRTVRDLEDVVSLNQITRDFDASILELKSIIGQVQLEQNQTEKDMEMNPIMEELDLSSVGNLRPNLEVEKYIDNRESSKEGRKTDSLTSIIPLEDVELLKKVKEGSLNDSDLDKETISSETREYLSQSKKISDALKNASKAKTISVGYQKFLSTDERAEEEKREFEKNFLTYVKKPSIYEMSNYELQRFAAVKGLKNFETMSRNELLSFVENPLRLYGENFITQNPYIERLKIELADNDSLRDDVVLAESKVVESLKAAKAYTSKSRASAITWQAFFIVTLMIVIAAIIGIVVYFVAFNGGA